MSAVLDRARASSTVAEPAGSAQAESSAESQDHPFPWWPLLAASPRDIWLFSPALDFAAFVLPALLSFALIALGKVLGLTSGETPSWLWLTCLLGVDVSHVWATGYRVYADPVERARRPVLYWGTPVLAYALGAAVHLGGGALLFWRVLAYLATFHFIRQQYGWMALYRRRAGEPRGVGAWIDAATIYLTTLYPLAVWHASSPRQFHWFVPGDFVLGLPPWVPELVRVVYGIVLGAYVVRALLQGIRGYLPLGKHLLVVTTALCWYVGIVVYNSDYVFTVTNVLIHGVPYFFLLYRYGRRSLLRTQSLAGWIIRQGAAAFWASLVVAAFGEEALWDGLVWHDHPAFFGGWSLHLSQTAIGLVVPLLALPQVTHYVLDAFIWRSGARGSANDRNG
jgi:hypothetical protein